MQRVIKAVLPDNVQIGKDAKAAFSRSAGIFIMSVLVILAAAWYMCVVGPLFVSPSLSSRAKYIFTKLFLRVVIISDLTLSLPHPTLFDTVVLS